MKRWIVILFGLTFFVIALAELSLAAGVADVSIKTNTHISGFAEDKVLACEFNRIEIWIQNDAPIYELSLGIQLSSGSGPWAVTSPYGEFPVNSPVLAVYDPQPRFDVAFEVDISQLPNAIFIHGVASNDPLPASALSQLVYSIEISDRNELSVSGGFCVDNIVNPFTGQWSFKDESYFAPTFNSQPNASITDPSAPARCFNVEVIPCAFPYYTSTPPALVTVGICDSYSFDFESYWPLAKCGKGNYGSEDGSEALFPDGGTYSATIGEINRYTGIYTLTPIGVVDTVHEVVYLHGNLCDSIAYEFDIIHAGQYLAPAITYNPPLFHVKSGTTRIQDFGRSIPGQCAIMDWDLTLLSQPAPASVISFDQLNGRLTVDAVPADLDQLFEFRITVTDPLGSADSCQFQLAVVSFLSGDADHNSMVNVSDAIYIINCIFAGGEECINVATDANCDGLINISDAVYLISYIFAGGPAPC